VSDDAILSAVLDALLDCMAFLELSDEESVNTDDAVRTLETVGWRLQQLSPHDQSALTTMIVARAKIEANPQRRRFTEATPDALGLLDAGDD
jgi:hypothetical protein